jgi:hypothetical protein
MTVWKDADEARYHFPQPETPPKTVEALLREADELYKDPDQSYAYKAGFFYGLIQLLEFEIALLKLSNESLACGAQQSTSGNKGGN